MVSTLVLLAACHSTVDETGGKLIDAPPIAPDAPHHSVDAAPIQDTVQVLSYGFPASFAAYYTASTGTWQTPAFDGMYTYTLDVAGSDLYEFVLACDDGAGNSGASELAQAYPADPTQNYVYCEPASTASLGGGGGAAEVTGTMQQAGQLWLDAYVAGSATGPWSFDVSIYPQTYDLFATGSNAMLARFSDVISGTDNEPTIDLVADGAPYQVSANTVANAGSDALAMTVTFYSQNGYAQVTSAGTTANLPPAAVASNLEYQSVAAEATSADGLTVREASNSTGATAFTLPPALGGVVFAADGATTKVTFSTGVPNPTDEVLSLYASEIGATQSQQVQASEAWLTATGATALEFDASAPGFPTDHDAPPASTVAESLEIDGMSPDGVNSVTSIAFGPATAQPAHAHPRPRPDLRRVPHGASRSFARR